MALIDSLRKNYSPVGYCIYCGNQEDLTREHIIPYALGVKWVLPSSSCKDCAKITSQIERKVTKEMYGHMRHQFGFPSRRAKPKEIIFNVHYGEMETLKAIPIIDSPTAPILIPSYFTPGILLNAEPFEGFNSHIDFWIWLPHKDLDYLKKLENIHQNKATSISVDINYHQEDFVRLLAKISHAGAIAEYGIKREQSYLVDYILGKNRNFMYIIGGCAEPCKADPNQMWCVEYGIYNRGDKKFLTCKLELFKFLGGPTHWVVVCEADDSIENRVLNNKVC